MEKLIEEGAKLLGQYLRPVIIDTINEALRDIKRPQESPPDDGLFTLQEAMAFLRCSKTAIYSYQRAGTIKSYRIGNKVFFKKANLLNGLKERSNNSKNQKP